MRTVLRPTSKMILEVPDPFAPYWSLPPLDQVFRTVHLLTFSRHAIFRLMRAADYSIVPLDWDAIHSIRALAEPIAGREMVAKEKLYSVIKAKFYFELWKMYALVSDTPCLGRVSFVFSGVAYRYIRR